MATALDMKPLQVLVRIAYVMSWQGSFDPHDELVLCIGCEGNEIPLVAGPGFVSGNGTIEHEVRDFIVRKEARATNVLSGEAEQDFPRAFSLFMYQLRDVLGVTVVVLRIGRPKEFSVEIGAGNPIQLAWVTVEGKNLLEVFQEALNASRNCVLGKERVV